MCGIAGLVLEASSADGAVHLREMTRRLAHRGPDDEGFLHERAGGRFVGLGHRRLAIIDLHTGRQPIANEDGTVQVVLNGEIYNYQELRRELEAAGHRFTTSSDTETIVHAYEEYGDACVARLRGMFAFALWDATRKRLLLARDRFGKKPLFIHEGRAFAFASEIDALLAVPGVDPRLDHDALADYLIFRYVPAPATLFATIQKLMPGHYGVWEAGAFSTYRYYEPPDAAPRIAAALPADPVAGFLAKLDEAVRVRMISDVPFGAFLSGGLDSSAIVALMARHSSERVRTFSVGFDSAAFDELPHARRVASALGTEHTELRVDATHLLEHLPALIRSRGAPIAEPSDIPIYLLSREARKAVKMVLTGEGSDEILAGYPKHVAERYASAYQRIPGVLRHAMIEPGIDALPFRFQRAKTAIASLHEQQFGARMARWFGGFSASQRDALTTLEGRSVPERVPVRGNSALREILHFDQTSWLPDNLLERGDRMTMAASLEARMPFMDHELAAYVSALPDDYRVRGRTTKWILRAAMAGVLPRETMKRRKVGFRVPVSEWFRGQMKDYLRDHLLAPDARTHRYYRPGAVARLLDEHLAGRHNHEKVLWSLLTLEIWHREYGVS